MIERLYFIYIFFLQFYINNISTETVHGCTNNRDVISTNRTSVTLSCQNNGYILVQNLTFGVHKTSNLTCSYQQGDCTTRTTYIGMECNGLKTCHLDLNPQYLHICSQYSDYMVLDYLCLQGESLSICDNRFILTSPVDMRHNLLLHSPNYPNEYENSLNCLCEIHTKKSHLEFLDFYLEERDEMNFCTRDYLQIDNQSYCDSTIDQKLDVNSSIYLTFKTNDVITRKGFWLMMNSDQSIEISCKNSLDLPFPTTSTPLTTTTTVYLTSILPLTNSSNIHSTRRYTLSFILILTIIFVIILLILNLILIILCWKQRRTKENRLDSKTGTTHQPFFCSKRYSTSSSSSITYGETPVLNSLDAQKNQQTTSTTTATTGTYEDPNECLNFQQKQKFDLNHSFYLKHRPEPKIFSPIILPSSPPPTTTMHTGYNPMIHSHFNISSQTFYPFGSQHIYETIPDGYCPYQRLASTLRRQQQQCTCYCTHNEQKHLTKIDDQENNLNIESNPETLV